MTICKIQLILFGFINCVRLNLTRNTNPIPANETINGQLDKKSINYSRKIIAKTFKDHVDTSNLKMTACDRNKYFNKYL